jgi:predicted regulator of Ras-like GTPase activity (Roadblock/LC7/MglB family)
MLSTLFGDLGSARDAKSRPDDDFDETQQLGDDGFAATAILETSAAEVNERGQIVDRHLTELAITGSPAQAIREHFAQTRSDLETASSMITLLDPVGVWASAVVKALSDAGGRPIERLHLREDGTDRSLATIERTTLVRRNEDTLKVFHADVRAPGAESIEIPVALMERSQLAAVIIGPMQPHAIDALLASLRQASGAEGWRCPHLLFQLPPNAPWIRTKIAQVRWPERLRVHVVSEPMTGASSVWNALLGVWTQARLQPEWNPAGVSPMLGTGDFPIKVGDIGGQAPADPRAAAAAGPTVYAPVGGGVPDATRSRHALASLLRIDGLIGCALVDAASGLVLSHEVRGEQPVDMELAAASCTQVLRTHREAARSMGLPDPVDEVITTAGSRHLLVRALQRHEELFLVALLEKHRTNLALARFQLLEVERALG